MNYFSAVEKGSPSHNHMDELLSAANFPLRVAFQTLLDALHVDKYRSSNCPYVVLAFDEAHTVTNVISSDNNQWSHFGEIRRAIRGLLNQPLFTLFLSTSGALFSTTPSPDHNMSGRMMSIGDVMLPFYELGFDQLAKCLDPSSQITLQQVTSEAHLTSYGRPLCALNVSSVHLLLTSSIDGTISMGLHMGRA